MFLGWYPFVCLLGFLPVDPHCVRSAWRGKYFPTRKRNRDACVHCCARSSCLLVQQLYREYTASSTRRLFFTGHSRSHQIITASRLQACSSSIAAVPRIYDRRGNMSIAVRTYRVQNQLVGTYLWYHTTKHIHTHCCDCVLEYSILELLRNYLVRIMV